MESEKLNVVSVRLVQEAPLLTDRKMDTPYAAIEILGKHLAEMDRELLCVINLNSAMKPINCSVVSMGDINRTIATPREILKTAILSNAACIMLMHNHPSGNVTPSRLDTMTTDQMVYACNIMGIQMVDHIIVGGNRGDFFSFREKEMLNEREAPDYKAWYKELDLDDATKNISQVAEQEKYGTDKEKEDMTMDNGINQEITNVTINEKETKFVNISFPKDKARPFNGKDGTAYYDISAGQGYSYIRPVDKVKDSVREEGNLWFSVPENYEFGLRRSVPDDNGGFKTEEMRVTAAELKSRHENYDKAPDFVRISVSEKRMVSTFTKEIDNEPVEFAKLLAPEGLSYIRRMDQIHKDKNNEGYVYFSVPKDYEISVRKRTDEIERYTEDNKPIYKEEQKKLTGEQLKELYDREKAGREQKESITEEASVTDTPFKEAPEPAEMKPRAAGRK